MSYRRRFGIPQPIDPLRPSFEAPRAPSPPAILIILTIIVILAAAAWLS